MGAEDRYCGECGAAAGVGAAVPASDEGELKHVTVMFVDVVHSMDLAERLPPDVWTQIMRQVFDAGVGAVERFGGTVDKFTGDGLMALFGAPVAQEDHALRACHAARALLEASAGLGRSLGAHGIELRIRVGLHSGQVAVGSIGTSGYTAVGHAVGLAQRMESIALPGTACVSESTAEVLAGAFVLRDRGRVAVKGAAIPVAAFELGPPIAAAAPRRPSGAARFVGRDTELAMLEAALADAAEGRAQIVGIVGEAGAGKSRLCEELAQRARARGVTVRRAAGVSHARTVPLLPIVAWLRDYFAVEEGERPAEVREKVERRLLDLDAGLDADLSLVFDLMEVPDPARPAPLLGPEGRRRRVLDLFRRVTLSRSKREGLLLLLEDLHWFDPQSIAFLDAWLPSFPGTRTLVVTNFRPEFRPPWAHHSYYRQIPLSPLDERATTDLLTELLGSGSGLDDLADKLRLLANGNPFFIEEIVRGLAAEGTLQGAPGAYRLMSPVTDVRVPVTVEAVLAQRIDSLAAGDKQTLAAAAVIGRTFADRLLLGVLSGAGDDLAGTLDRLCAAELLQRTDDPGEYRFWHPLTQEVAYGTLVGPVRRRLHAKVANTLTASGADQVPGLAPLVAAHFEAADDHLEAARWQLRAGFHITLRDFIEAQRRFRAVIRHLALCPVTPETLSMSVQARTFLLRLGARTGIDPAEADRLFSQARAEAERLGDPQLLAGLWLADGAVRLWSHGDPGRAADSWREVPRHTQQPADPGYQAWGSVALAAALSYTGPLPEGLRALDAGFTACAGDPLVGISAAGYSAYDGAHTIAPLLLALSGDLPGARRHLLAALVGFRERPVAEWTAWALAYQTHITDLTGEQGELPESRRAGDEALRLARDSGNVAASVRALHAVGLAELLAGRPGEGSKYVEEGLAQMRKHHSGLQDEPLLEATLARCRLASGDVAGARAAAAESVALADSQGAAVSACKARLVLTQILRVTATDASDRAAAVQALYAAEALGTQVGAITYLAFLAEERARLAGYDFGPVIELYESVGATGHARRLLGEPPLPPCP